MGDIEGDTRSLDYGSNRGETLRFGVKGFRLGPLTSSCIPTTPPSQGGSQM